MRDSIASSNQLLADFVKNNLSSIETKFSEQDFDSDCGGAVARQAFVVGFNRCLRVNNFYKLHKPSMLLRRYKSFVVCKRSCERLHADNNEVLD